MSEYIPRIVDGTIKKRLGQFGAVLVAGPKWCGKTTTSMRFAASQVSLTDPSNDYAGRRLATLDPAAVLVGETPRLVDEWQEVPKVWDAVRFECDRRGERGLYILTGSSTPDDEHAPMHSGAGRMARVRMDTMTLLERGVSSGAVSLSGVMAGECPATAVGSIDGVAAVADIVCHGGWPMSVGMDTSDAMDVVDAYVDAVCESDVSRVDDVRRDPAKVRTLLTSLARNESTLAGKRAVLADTGKSLSESTVSRYVDAFERIGLEDDIPAWDPALRSPVRLQHAKKRHLCDPSVAVSLLGASPTSLVADIKTLGLLFESLALHDLKVYAGACGASVSHYHDASGLEADAIVAMRDGTWAPVEVKLGPSQVDRASVGLLRLERKMVDHGERPPVAKIVIVGYGMPAHVTDDGVLVVPIDTLGI